jgi:hypothetical protein
MGGGAWGGHPDCPGTVRAAQRTEIIRRAIILRKAGPIVTGTGQAPFTAVQLSAVWSSKWGGSPTAGELLQRAAASRDAVAALTPVLDEILTTVRLLKAALPPAQ